MYITCLSSAYHYLLQAVLPGDFLGLTTPPHSPPDSTLCLSGPTATVVPCSQASSWTAPFGEKVLEPQHPSAVTECSTSTCTPAVSKEAVQNSHTAIVQQDCAHEGHAGGGHTSSLDESAGSASTVPTRGLCYSVYPDVQYTCMRMCKHVCSISTIQPTAKETLSHE